MSFNITSGNTFDMTSSLALQLGSLGFDLGGSHQRTTVTSLRITAEFPTQPKKGWR